MRILLVHNFYQQPGGEDQVFAAEHDLLVSRGHPVRRHVIHNDAINGMSKLTLAARTIHNPVAARDIAEIVAADAIEIVQFHTTVPLISPAAYRAARRAGAAVVQTLHNFRLLCPAATFLRDGRVCTDCLGQSPLPGALHACYRDSRLASATAAAMLIIQRRRGAYTRDVDRYIALTESGRRIFIQGGLPPDRIAVKPNFLDPDPGPGAGAGGYALFVGRLSPEKGIETLLRAAPKITAKMPLKIAGDGPLADAVRAAASSNPKIQWLGRQPPDRIAALMADAAVLLFPSIWFEGLPRTIIEAFAAGTPVVASDLGAMSTLITPDHTGELFVPGDPDALAAAALSIPDRPSMRAAARARYLRLYTPAANHEALMAIYQHALAHRAAHAG